MITDWTIALADYCRERLPPEVIEVYSDYNPSREWDGSPTLEFSVRNIQQTNFITGGFVREITLSAVTRSLDERQAETTIIWALNTALKQALNEWQSANTIQGWTLIEIATSPDARGLATGESFYGYVDFIIYERPSFF